MGPSARHHPVVTTYRREKHLVSAKRRKGCASSQYGFGYKTAATGVSLLVMALFSSRAKGSVFDTPSEDLEEDDYLEYGTEVCIATAGLGVGLSLVFGALTFNSMLAMCCRCSRLRREDLAIAEAERNTGEEDKGLDDMYEVEDYEDKIAVQRGKLWILTLFLFLGYLFCAGYAYYGAKTADAAFNDIFDGTDALLTRVQTALCAENGAEDCADQSVGEFLLDTVAALMNLFDNIVGFLTSLTGVVTPLYWVSANLTSAVIVLNNTEAAVLNINATIPIINDILTGNGTVAELTDETTLVTLDASILQNLDDGKTALEAASNLTRNSITDVLNQLSGPSSSLARVQYQIDDISGNEIKEDEDVRNSTTQLVYDELDTMRGITRDIYKFQNGKIADVREFLDNYLEIAVQVVAGIIFLPGAILFLTAICSGICQSTKPLYLNMCFVFLSQILFCLVAGVFLAVAKINGDLCDHHLDFLEANVKENNITAQGTVITMDYDKLYLIMTCDGENGDTPTSTNNFIGILEAEQVFNMSKNLKSVSEMLTNNSDLLIEPKRTVKDAQDELTPLNDFVDMEVGEDVDIKAELDEINGLLNDMPSSPFDWDSRADQDAVDHFYLSDDARFSWNNETTGHVTYRSQLEDVNEIIGQMVAGVIGGHGFRHIKNPYNFTTARDLTSTTVCAETSNFYPDDMDPLRSSNLQTTIYTYAGQYIQLCHKVTEFSLITVKMEALIDKNDGTRVELENLRDSLENIDESINDIHGLQAQMGILRDDMNGSLIRILDSLDGFVDDIDDLAGSILGLNEHFIGADKYTMCGYIGTFYKDVYLDAMCTDLQGNIESVAGPALCVVILMFLSFCVQGCYGPSMRKRPHLNIDLEPASAEEIDAGTIGPNPPIPHSPTPLDGNSGS